jgi:hypothetical protein
VDPLTEKDMLTTEEIRDKALYVLTKYVQDSGGQVDRDTFQTLYDYSFDSEGDIVIQRWDVPNTQPPDMASIKATYALTDLAPVEHVWQDYYALRGQSRVLVTVDRQELSPYAAPGNLVYDESDGKLYVMTSSG